MRNNHKGAISVQSLADALRRASVLHGGLTENQARLIGNVAIIREVAAQCGAEFRDKYHMLRTIQRCQHVGTFIWMCLDMGGAHVPTHGQLAEYAARILKEEENNNDGK